MRKNEAKLWKGSHARQICVDLLSTEEKQYGGHSYRCLRRNRPFSSRKNYSRVQTQEKTKGGGFSRQQCSEKMARTCCSRNAYGLRGRMDRFLQKNNPVMVSSDRNEPHSVHKTTKLQQLENRRVRGKCLIFLSCL